MGTVIRLFEPHTGRRIRLSWWQRALTLRFQDAWTEVLEAEVTAAGLPDLLDDATRKLAALYPRHAAGEDVTAEVDEITAGYSEVTTEVTS